MVETLKEILFNVIAIGAKQHQLTVEEEIGQRVGDALAIDETAAHIEHRFNMAVIHRRQGLLVEGPQELSAWTCGQHQTASLVLHRAVVSQ